MSTHDVRRSSGGSSSAIEEPEADRHRRDAERERDEGVERRGCVGACERERAAAADDDRDDRRDRRVPQRGPRSRRSGGTKSVLSACELGERAVEVEPVAARACAATARRGRAIGPPSSDGHHREVRADDRTLARAVRGRRAVSRAGRSRSATRVRDPRAGRSTTSSASTATSCTTVSAAATGEVQELRGLAVDLGLERRVPRAAEDEDHAERREA